MSSFDGYLAGPGFQTPDFRGPWSLGNTTTLAKPERHQPPVPADDAGPTTWLISYADRLHGWVSDTLVMFGRVPSRAPVCGPRSWMAHVKAWRKDWWLSYL